MKTTTAADLMDDELNPKVLIITGMHRSTTSLVTQWLQRCGLFIGERFIGAGPGNIQGRVEDFDFLKMHEHLLKKRHSSTAGLVHRPIRQLTCEEVEALKTLIENRNKEHLEWGWTDARTCLFLDVYARILPFAFYLIIVRDYTATINSMVMFQQQLNLKRFQSKKGISRLVWKLFKMKRLKKPFEVYTEKFLKIWIYYYKTILRHVRLLPEDQYMFVHYKQLVYSDAELFKKLTLDWHFSLHYSPFVDVFKKELLHRPSNIDKYVRDRGLIEQAKAIEDHIVYLLDPMNVKIV
ncbi:MAG TPA: hypothetical protein VGQ53_18905 [Chitinophagaceae bacterium]|jgi:hypothetical protein|nr:hypothetical protein [Chitinophagaceae bacterium]